MDSESPSTSSPSPPPDCLDDESNLTATLQSVLADPSLDQRRLIQNFNFWTLGVLMPAIAVFGILANAASIVVLTRRTMKTSPINVYLAGLSAFDGLLLLMTLLLYPALSYCEMEETTSSSWCQYFFYSALFTYPISLVMQCASVYTLTAITIDRFLAITWPLQSRDWCTSRRANWVMAGICVWSFLYNLPAFFELRLVPLPSPSSEFAVGLQQSPEELLFEYYNISLNITSTSDDRSSEFDSTSSQIMVLTQTDLRRDPNYVVAYKGYCYVIFMLLLPAGLMIFLNFFVTWSVRKAYRLRKAMSGREEKERRCTIMAVLVVVTFLVLNSLAFVNNVIEIFATSAHAKSSSTSSSSSSSSSSSMSQEASLLGDHMEMNISSIEHHIDQAQSNGNGGGQGAAKSTAYLLLVSVGNVLVALNSATNFLIYCALGLRFRKMFCKIFCPRRCAQSLLANDLMANEKSYQSLNVRYSIAATAAAGGGDKHRRREPRRASSSVSASPMIDVRNGSLLSAVTGGEDGYGSSGVTSITHSPGSFSTPSPNLVRFGKTRRKNLGSFV